MNRAAFALLALVVSAVPASAQLGRVGGNPSVSPTATRGSDVAYDPANDVYLVVGAHGTVWGAFAHAYGAPLASPFVISNQTGFAQFPRVAYSPHVSNGAGGFGGFLVTWHENVGNNNFVHTRLVAYPNRLVGSVTVLSSGPTWWESGAAVAYSSSSQVFLVTWRSADYRILAGRIALNGAQAGSVIEVSDSSTGAGYRDPNVAWNSTINEFGVVYAGFGGASPGHTSFARVNPAGFVVARNTFNLGQATYITDLAYNPHTGRYMAAWIQQSMGTMGAEIDSGGTAVAQGLVSTITGTLDALGLAYNIGSGTFLLVGQGNSTYEVMAAELNSRGARTSADTVVTSVGAPSYYPRTAANHNARHWNISFARNFGALHDQVVFTTTTGGGPAGSLGAAPPSGGGSTGGSGSTCAGSAPFPGAVCVNGGWVPGGSSGDSGGGTSTGGCPGTAPFPGAVCVNGGWVAGSGGSGGTSTGGCPGTAPFPGAVCVNGGWVPGTSSGGSGGTSTGGCPGTAPFPGAVCVNGGWVPGGSSDGSGGTSTGGCPGSAPFPGAVCVNGGWVPGGTGGTSTGGCPGTAPFAGAVCVNGGWVPGSSSGGCTTPDPFTSIGGGTCVNGGWIPGTSSSSGGCTTPSPGSGWVCINGGWLPPTNPAAGVSTCSGSAPASGWVCVSGGWLPPDNPAAASYVSGGCTTPDPFTAIGGGLCVNGGWIPRQ